MKAKLRSGTLRSSKPYLKGVDQSNRSGMYTPLTSRRLGTSRQPAEALAVLIPHTDAARPSSFATIVLVRKPEAEHI